MKEKSRQLRIVEAVEQLGRFAGTSEIGNALYFLRNTGSITAREFDALALLYEVKRPSETTNDYHP